MESLGQAVATRGARGLKKQCETTFRTQTPRRSGARKRLLQLLAGSRVDVPRENPKSPVTCTPSDRLHTIRRMRNAWLLAILVGSVAVCAAVEFEQHRQSWTDGVNGPGGFYYGDGYYGQVETAAVQQRQVAAAAAEEESARFHHGKHKKLKKLKKRLLLQCLLGHGRRRRDTSDAASGRFLLPVVLQSTNVNVGSGGGGGGGAYGDPQQYGGGGGCMEMFNDHGPALGSLGSGLGGLLGSPPGDPVTGEGGARGGGSYPVNWNRYARQFHRNYVRPLYRLF